MDASQRIRILPGALATEAYLLERLEQLQAQSRANPELLRHPIRILVPSRSLRLHLSERIVARLGCVAGLQIQTLQNLALTIVQNAGQEPHCSNLLVEILCRRAALAEAPLRKALEGFEDGLLGISGVIRDLFDAGFEKHAGQALLELIEDVPLSARSLRRARSLLEVAMRVDQELTQRASGGRAALLQQARACLTQEPDPLPTRMLFVHGFADVTGRAGDLLQRLAQRPTTEILIDHPRDPGDPAEADRGIEFTQRLLQPLEGIAGRAASDAATTEPPSLRAFSAPGRQAELREVALRIRALLEAGLRPERIGIVARNPKHYALALRRQLKMLGVPFSAPGLAGPMDAAARRILALGQLFDQGLRCPLDRCFDALAERPAANGEALESTPSAAQMLLGLRVTGAGRLGDVLRINTEHYLDRRGELPLPLTERVQTGAEQDATGARFRAPGRRLAGQQLKAWIARADALARHFEASPALASAGEHLLHFEALRRQLGWQPGDATERRIAPALQSLAQGIGEEALQAHEFAGLLLAGWQAAALPPLGWQETGAGVQVLDAMEARARTFEQLFLIGLNRDVFPRTISADPIFPDELRTKLETILPDIPIQARGRLEDRYLFAQLLSSSESVTLSWLHTGEDGKPRMLSPLVERVFDQETLKNLQRVSARFPGRPSADQLAAPRDAHEQAILSALHGTPGEFEAHLELALEELGAPLPGPLAKSRARILGAYESTKDRGQSMGPWLGFLGTQEELGVRPDPRQEAAFVTRIEGIARCPWKTVLTRFLKLERAPDPLGDLPGISPLTLGNIVHHVLCRIDQRVLGTTSMGLDQALALEPKQVDWPAEEEFERILLEEAHREARLKFEPIPGFVRVLAECARPYLQAAQDLLLAERKQNVGLRAGALGAEVKGRAQITRANGQTIDVVFQADRVERQGDRVLLSDYKTGAFKSANEMRSKGVPQGDQLQPMAYILAAREHAESVRGRYLYLGARAQRKEVVEVALDQDAEEQIEDFTEAVGCVLDGWVAGAFFPRLMRPESGMPNPDCERCEVKEACLQGDSGAREAISSWARPGAGHPASGATSKLWHLRGKQRLKQKRAKGGKS